MFETGGFGTGEQDRSLGLRGLTDLFRVSLGLLHDRGHAQACGAKYEIVLVRCRQAGLVLKRFDLCLLYTSPSPRD